MKQKYVCRVKNRFKKFPFIIMWTGNPDGTEPGKEDDLKLSTGKTVKIWLKPGEEAEKVKEPPELYFKSDSSSEYGPEGDYFLKIKRTRKKLKLKGGKKRKVPMWKITWKRKGGFLFSRGGPSTLQHVNVTVSDEET
jgi:hypothetical protein